MMLPEHPPPGDDINEAESMVERQEADEQIKMIVISSCSASKSVEVPRPITMSKFADPDRLWTRERELSADALPAWELYAGRQHSNVMKGVQAIRASFGQGAVTLKIVSAGYGLVDEEQRLAPYEATFKELSRRERRKRASLLGIASAVRAAIDGYPLAIFLLGATYLDAIETPIEPGRNQRLLYLAAPGEAAKLAAARVTAVPTGKPEARAYRSGFVALKGVMFLSLALALTRRGKSLYRRLLEDDSPGTFLNATLGRDVAP